MFNLSGSEIIVILLLALVVLGPEKLPEALRRAGRTYAELKKMGNSFQDEVRSVLDEPMKEMRETADLLRESADFTDSAKSGQGPRTPAVTTSPAPEEPTDGGGDPDASLINRTLGGGSDPTAEADENTTT